MTFVFYCGPFNAISSYPGTDGPVNIVRRLQMVGDLPFYRISCILSSDFHQNRCASLTTNKSLSLFQDEPHLRQRPE
jgi:hypothetical protein